MGNLGGVGPLRIPIHLTVGSCDKRVFLNQFFSKRVTNDVTNSQTISDNLGYPTTKSKFVCSKNNSVRRNSIETLDIRWIVTSIIK